MPLSQLTSSQPAQASRAFFFFLIALGIAYELHWELPIELPIALPIALPIELPIELPIALPIALPTALPIALPIAYCIAPSWYRLVLSDPSQMNTPLKLFDPSFSDPSL